MATPFIKQASPDQHQDHQLNDGEEENTLKELKSRDYEKLVNFISRKRADSGIQDSFNFSQSYVATGNTDENSDRNNDLTNSFGSGPHPSSNHTSSEFSNDDAGAVGNYKISVEETKKRRKSGT